MTNTIDGFAFDVPPLATQIVDLAHHHRKKLDEAIFRRDVHLGEYCLAQRKRVADFAKTLDREDRVAFYRAYDGELLRIADEDELHPAEAEAGLSIFAIFLVLAIIALVLYFAVIRGTIG
ncbi:hypothetical protein IS511_07340 [Acinetobacter towneri]|uniref:hypothetical protein n=1 Tax=Acinetobacter towneri TaxID=202956 RepID=UPI00188D703E|nr:hypothetical protein [Acinetobacter towneri]MBF4520990.1 hypothetical protein [Acinetobacter towneri]MEB6565527.1 hypothetical protein [Acinetobacter towneri]